jgi:hypothetical protein
MSRHVLGLGFGFLSLGWAADVLVSVRCRR